MFANSFPSLCPLFIYKLLRPGLQMNCTLRTLLRIIFFASALLHPLFVEFGVVITCCLLFFSACTLSCKSSVALTLLRFLEFVFSVTFGVIIFIVPNLYNLHFPLFVAFMSTQTCSLIFLLPTWSWDCSSLPFFLGTVLLATSALPIVTDVCGDCCHCCFNA